MAYIIGPFEKPEESCSIDRHELVNLLLDTWADIKIRQRPLPSLLYWQIFSEEDSISCRLLSEDSVSIDNATSDVLITRFMLWFRNIFPSHCKLFVYVPEMLEDSLELSRDVEEKDISNWLRGNTTSEN